MNFKPDWCGVRLSKFDQKPTKIAAKKKLKRSPFILGSFCTLWLALFCGITPSVIAAERLMLRVGPFQRSVPVTDLEQFANTGKLSPQLKPYAPLLTPKVKQLLNRRLQIDPSIADKFLEELFSSSDGEKLIEQLRTALPGTSIETLKLALGLAVRQANDLSVLSFLRAFPSESITIDVTSAVGIAVQLNTSHLQSKVLSPLLERELEVEEDILSSSAIVNRLDPTKLGKETVRKRTLLLRDKRRKRTIPVDIYTSTNTQGPLIVMSHGFAADRNFFNYLAHHLTSYGFTVASVEHPGSNVNSLNEMSVGINLRNLLPASEFIDRPKDISFLLDHLEKIQQERKSLKDKFNTKQVSVIGHSFGGYTALALAGGELDPKASRSFCQQFNPLGRSPGDWLQCAAVDLPYSKLRLKDNRVKQVIAFNPIIGQLFGENGLAKVTAPTLIFSSSEDAVTPSLDHQIRPFKQLQGEKYFIAAIGGTHMSVTDMGNLDSPMGQSTLVKELMGRDAEPIRKLARGVSLSLVNQLTPEAKIYQPFLTSAYVQSLSTSTLSMRLTTEIPRNLERWLSTLYLGTQQIAKVKLKQESLLTKLQNSFAQAKKMLPQPQYRTGQLNNIFTSLVIYDNINTGKS